MGFNFRKSFKIAPGIRLNVGKKGISSLSVGGKGARVSVGKKGVRTTVGIPGSGLSYSSHTPYEQRKTAANGSDDQDSIFIRKLHHRRSIEPNHNTGLFLYYSGLVSSFCHISLHGLPCEKAIPQPPEL